MKLVMTLLVRDEEDIIASNIEFHLSRGVDFFIAMDNLSSDRTTNILRGYERRGLLHYIAQTGDNFSQHLWVTQMARLAFSQFGADWVINNDADEFWWTDSRDLKSVLLAIPLSCDAVVVERKDFVPRRNVENEFFADVMTYRELQSYNVLGQPLPPKVCHRAFADVYVAQGNHSVHRHGQSIPVQPACITIFHFPVRSYAQFCKRTVHGGAAYARNTELDPSVGATRRYLYGIWERGELESYYRKLVAESERSIAENRAIFDDRLKRVLVELGCTSAQSGR